MAVGPGTRLGAYEIIALIGAGGMGEVYRARDTRLNRDVALKVLPELFAADPDRLARFKREAQLLASLNHPNIAAIHGFEEQTAVVSGFSRTVEALVLELVEGPTLADRIAQGPMPLDEVLPIARQIAEALEAAHERGIVHRDLKPANIKIRPDGTVKVLDFGLAKAFEGDAAASASAPLSSMSPTLTSPAATRAGMILGTAAYMSPEQTRGKAVDKRSDIWAFGCVLYEMLTGTRPFDGEGAADVMARIIEREPDYTAIPAAVPPVIRRLLHRCLEKDRKQRLPDIGVARLDIDDARAAPAGAAALTAEVPRGWRERAIWSVALVTTAVATAAVAAWYVRPAAVGADVRFDIPVRPMRWANEIAISPDGRRVAYSAARDDGRYAVWIRDLDSLQSRVVAGTEASGSEAVFPAWSPDGRFIVFAADGNLKKVEVAGGPAQTLVPSLGGQFGGATWNRDDVIVFASNGHGLRRVAATGGEVSPVSERSTALEEIFHDAPMFLPDQRRFLYLAWSSTTPENSAIYAGSLDDSARTLVMKAESNAVYSGGHLLFLRGGALVARPFDPARLQFTGEPVSIAGRITVAGGELGAFAASEAGVLIYREAAGATNRQLVWMDRDGRTAAASALPFQATAVKLSPDDRQVVFTEGETPDVWVYDFARNVRTRLTTDPSTDHNPVWSPDGSRVLFDSHRTSASATVTGDATIFEKASSGATAERPIIDPERGAQKSPRDWSRDGRMVVFGRLGESTPWNLWVLPLDGDRKPFPFRSGAFNEPEAALAPNGRWLAFTSNESGSNEVIVQPFPDPSGGKWQISTDGGVHPRWRRDGRELYYLDPKGRIVAVTVTTDSTFEIQRAVPLVQTPLPLPIATGGSLFPYDVTSDGKRFLLTVPMAGSTPAPITVVLNWTLALTR